MEKSPKLKNIFMILAIGFLVMPVFFSALGNTLLGTDEKQKAVPDCSNESHIIFLVSTIISQISFSLVSQLPTCCLMLPCFEASASTRKILHNCMSADGSGFINVLVCLTIAAIALGVVAFLIGALKLGKYAKRIPYILVYATMMQTGIGMLVTGVQVFGLSKDKYTWLFAGISVALSIGAIVLLKTTDSPLLVMLYMGLIIAVMNGMRIYVPSDMYLNYRLFPTDTIRKLSMTEFISKIDFEQFDGRKILENILSILTLTLFPLISFATSFPEISNKLNLKISPNREFKGYGFANILCALGCFPTNFNCSGTLLLYICGLRNRMFGFLLGALLVHMYFTAHVINKYFPTFVTALVTQFLGISFLIAYLPELFSFSLLDAALCASAVFGMCYFYKDFIVGVIVAIACPILASLAISLCFQRFSNSIKTVDLSDKIIVIVQGKLEFYNIHKITDLVIGADREISLDLSDCIYVDLTANIELRKIRANKKLSPRLVVSGKPFNIYKDVLSA
ncbi:hypothetical protein ENBRE01_2780 [Enteropsectra breve]|nr:hypothetical protein ENBRE01_2780 [Enteropsectra breve]